MTPLETELEHLCRIATRRPSDTDHSHDQWVQFVTRKATALAARSHAGFADLPAALSRRLKSASPALGPQAFCSKGSNDV